MSLNRFHRSPLGVFVRSPLGVRSGVQLCLPGSVAYVTFAGLVLCTGCRVDILVPIRINPTATIADGKYGPFAYDLGESNPGTAVYKGVITNGVAYDDYHNTGTGCASLNASLQKDVRVRVRVNCDNDCNFILDVTALVDFGGGFDGMSVYSASPPAAKGPCGSPAKFFGDTIDNDFTVCSQPTFSLHGTAVVTQS